MSTKKKTLKSKDEPTIWFVDDALWAQIQPLLVVEKPRKKPGRPRRDDRAILNALIWLGRTGVQWKQLPKEYPPKSTVHDRLQEWVEHGCLERVWAVLLRDYDNRFGIEWMWQSADGCMVKAPLGKKGTQARRRASGATPRTGASSEPSGT
jgi:putative transposase